MYQERLDQILDLGAQADKDALAQAGLTSAGQELMNIWNDMDRGAVKDTEAFEQFTNWAKEDSQVFERLTRLIKERFATPLAESASRPLIYAILSSGALFFCMSFTYTSQSDASSFYLFVEKEYRPSINSPDVGVLVWQSSVPRNQPKEG